MFRVRSQYPTFKQALTTVSGRKRLNVPPPSWEVLESLCLLADHTEWYGGVTNPNEQEKRCRTYTLFTTLISPRSQAICNTGNSISLFPFIMYSYFMINPINCFPNVTWCRCRSVALPGNTTESNVFCAAALTTKSDHELCMVSPIQDDITAICLLSMLLA